jgi:hypothetical protein
MALAPFFFSVSLGARDSGLFMDVIGILVSVMEEEVVCLG